MRKSNYLCTLSYVYRTLSLQSFDTNFSSLELLVTDISAVLLVYPLRLQMLFFYSLSSLKYSRNKKYILFIYPLHGYRILSYQSFDTNFSCLGLLVAEIYTFPLAYPLYFSEIFYLIFKVLIYIPTMRKSN